MGRFCVSISFLYMSDGREQQRTTRRRLSYKEAVRSGTAKVASRFDSFDLALSSRGYTSELSHEALQFHTNSLSDFEHC